MLSGRIGVSDHEMTLGKFEKDGGVLRDVIFDGFFEVGGVFGWGTRRSLTINDMFFFPMPQRDILWFRLAGA